MMRVNIRFRHKRNKANNICPRLDNVETRRISNNILSKIIVTFQQGDYLCKNSQENNVLATCISDIIQYLLKIVLRTNKYLWLI